MDEGAWEYGQGDRFGGRLAVRGTLEGPEGWPSSALWAVGLGLSGG